MVFPLTRTEVTSKKKVALKMIMTEKKTEVILNNEKTSKKIATKKTEIVDELLRHDNSESNFCFCSYLCNHLHRWALKPLLLDHIVESNNRK
ncbi:hypothetical protein ACMBCN_03190, partial [Candidatus Liberibacter asiaticus]|nr:hypothetical protein [Candidatus Liberibacter asiaticus]